MRTWGVGIFLTIRSLTRGNIGTSVMTVLLMSLIFINLIFLTSIINGLTHTAHRQIIETLTGHILVEPSPGDIFVEDAEDVRHDILLVPDVVAVSSRVNFSAELEFAGEQGSFRGVAIDPDTEAHATAVKDNIIAGRYLRADDEDAIIIGNQVAGGEDVELQAYSLKGAQVGDVVTTRFSDGRERDYEVVGIFDSNFVQSDNRFFINEEAYIKEFPNHARQASEFAVRIREDADLDATAERIAQVSDVSVRTWEETAGIVESFTSSFDIVNFIVSIVAVIVAGVTIFIVMYVDVVNRRRQIGILRAIGISEMSIAISYLLRAMLYAALGVLIGMALFQFVVIPLFVRNPVQLPVGFVSLVIQQDIMYVRAAALLLVSFLGAFVPIRRALRMHIIDAIWGK